MAGGRKYETRLRILRFWCECAMVNLGLLGFMENEWEMRKGCIHLGFEYDDDIIENVDASNDVSSGGCSWASD